MTASPVCPSPPHTFCTILILGDDDGLSVGDLEGVRVGSFDRGAMVGDPGGRAGQNVGHALDVSPCCCMIWDRYVRMVNVK